MKGWLIGWMAAIPCETPRVPPLSSLAKDDFRNLEHWTSASDNGLLEGEPQNLAVIRHCFSGVVTC